MTKLQLKIEIPKVHICSVCPEKITRQNVRIKHGQRYCSLECEDRGEEKNQGDDYKALELEALDEEG
jgi:hypothetical protein